MGKTEIVSARLHKETKEKLEKADFKLPDEE